ncbi:adhesin transport system outer membrane protein [Oxalobacteraceae bacterium GrIS 2.11]
MLNKKLLLILALLPLISFAEVQTIKDAAQEAVLTNPEVLLKWHAFQAAKGERDVAFGNYYPHVDVQANTGYERHSDPLLVNNYNSHGQSITLSQMIYDGFATSNEVDRLDHNRLVKLYELYDVTETTTLEVAHAHLDVLRYRKLVGFAEENYVQHRALYDQLLSKAKAGVGRRVDLEQSAGRLALAEANLLSETSNLHDVSARYQRLVGQRPGKNLDEPVGLNQGIPPELGSALQISNTSNPAILAAIENIRVADSDASGHRSAFQPRVDVRLSDQHGTNINSEIGQSKDKTAEVVLTWNLFNGFSDRAKLHQLADQINMSRDYRDKVCRDMRQNLEIAYNDNHKIAELLKYLDQHQLSIEKARDAYRQQFDIGQRTLLDLLDTENELFQARRAYVEAEYDQQVAFARVQAGMGNLFRVLGLSRPDAGPLPKFSNDDHEGEIANCPIEAPETYVANKVDLDQRAAALLKGFAPVVTPPATESATPAEVKKTVTVPETGAAQTLINDALNGWRQAWSARDTDKYLQFYAPLFKASIDASHEKWLSRRQRRIGEKKQISVDLSDLQFKFTDATHATTIFHQKYSSDIYHDVVLKTLDWELIDGRWLITLENPEAY